MNTIKMNVKILTLSILMLGLLLMGCTKQSELKKVKIALDWTPNTNHTGLYVAKSLGYYKDQGLDVEILLPSDSSSDAMVASRAVSFGVSYQENVTLSRNQGVPIVSIAAVIQHNTSGFASPKVKGLVNPKDFEGKIYGGWGSPAELATIKSVMKLSGGDDKKVKVVNIGESDFFTAVKRDIDFAWIYYAWTGIDAELRNEPLNMLYLKDIDPQLDYYTPVIITSEKMIVENPDIVRAFMKAVSDGYTYAILNPESAATILTNEVPELDKKLVSASQKWLSSKYQDDASQWGLQTKEIWENYSKWMLNNNLLDKPFEVNSAFTNDFLPKIK